MFFLRLERLIFERMNQVVNTADAAEILAPRAAVGQTAPTLKGECAMWYAFAWRQA
jgi:hypothetical protein